MKKITILFTILTLFLSANDSNSTESKKSERPSGAFYFGSSIGGSNVGYKQTTEALLESIENDEIQMKQETEELSNNASASFVLGFISDDEDRFQFSYTLMNNADYYDQLIHTMTLEKLFTLSLFYKSFGILPYIGLGFQYGFEEFTEEENEKYTFTKEKKEFFGATAGFGLLINIISHFELGASYYKTFQMWDEVEYNGLTYHKTDPIKEIDSYKVDLFYRF
jgi:opacity protein-like surface antigen